MSSRELRRPLRLPCRLPPLPRATPRNMPVSYCLDDALIMEAVAQQGGYEEVERLQLWEAVASALKLKKAQVPLMKRRYEDMLRVTAEEQEDAAEADGEEEHEVERVVNVRTTHDGKKEYQVKWVGDDELTWEPEANLNCDNLVERFEEGRSGGNGAPAAKRARARRRAAAARAAACRSRAATPRAAR